MQRKLLFKWWTKKKTVQDLPYIDLYIPKMPFFIEKISRLDCKKCHFALRKNKNFAQEKQKQKIAREILPGNKKKNSTGKKNSPGNITQEKNSPGNIAQGKK